jgi:hypothetical protein
MQMLRDEDGCVLTCTAADCSYNRMLECLAPNIQVGDDHPTCDTFTHDQNVQRAQRESIVATCKVGQCTFNDQMECHAPGITVDHHSQHADCVTFRP